MSYDFKGEIKNILDSNRFDSDDFIISITSSTVSIKYLYSNNSIYYFQFDIPNSREEIIDNNSVSFGLSKNTKWVYFFKGTLAPGKYSLDETFRYCGFNNVKVEITNWMNYLYEELNKESNDLNIKFNENDEELEKFKGQVESIKKLIDEQIDDNEMFSQEDKVQFNAKLDEIKNEFEEQLKKIISEQETLKAELDKINEDFSKLKDSLNYMSKKNWAKKFIGKTIDFFKDAKKRKITFTLLKSSNIFLKKFNIDIPLLGEAIETIEQVSGDKS